MNTTGGAGEKEEETNLEFVSRKEGWWSVASYFDNAGVPLGGVAVDIIRDEIYVSDEDGGLC